LSIEYYIAILTPFSWLIDNAPTSVTKDECLRGALNLDLVALAGRLILRLVLPVGPEVPAERYLGQHIPIKLNGLAH
jgi:hypothetical protein